LGYTSGRQVDRAINAIEKIDSLKAEGKEELADVVRGQLICLTQNQFYAQNSNKYTAHFTLTTPRQGKIP
jgi:hypothetical protein